MALKAMNRVIARYPLICLPPVAQLLVDRVWNPTDRTLDGNKGNQNAQKESADTNLPFKNESDKGTEETPDK